MQLQTMVSELVDFAGLTVKEIAELVDSNPASVSRVKTGAAEDLRYQTGKKIEELYEKHREGIKKAKLAKVHELTRDLEESDVQPGA